MFKSELDDIPGIGSKRKIKLLREFQTTENIKNASIEDLTKVIGEKIAKNIINYFKYKKTEKNDKLNQKKLKVKRE